MTVDDVMAELQALGSEKVRAQNARNGAGENQFGVKNGDLRPIAKRIKSDMGLARELWATGNTDARMLATLIVRPKELPAEELAGMVREATYPWLADWLNGYVVKLHPEKEALRTAWLDAEDPMLGRAGWSLTTERVAKSPEGLDLDALLDRIEREMGDAPRERQWTMNGCLATIGIESAPHRERAIAIGERIGAFRDYPTSKGCTSPFAPIWIAEMVRRGEEAAA